jgi:hypothetical protein
MSTIKGYKHDAIYKDESTSIPTGDYDSLAAGNIPNQPVIYGHQHSIDVSGFAGAAEALQQLARSMVDVSFVSGNYADYIARLEQELHKLQLPSTQDYVVRLEQEFHKLQLPSTQGDELVVEPIDDKTVKDPPSRFSLLELE